MNEKEKMISGEYYKPLEDEQLCKDRENAKNMCFKYNQLPPYAEEERDETIKE